MGRPKKEKEPNVESTSVSSDYISELIKDTDFKIAENGSLMHSRVKVKTPLSVLNCIYGGGLPLGIMSEVSGIQQSGKSTFLYQCMGNYQKQYPNGVAVILDMETSMDNERLESLGVDTSKVLRLPSTSMEKAFANMFKVLNKLVAVSETKKDISVFMIYDSLAAGGIDSEMEAAQKGESTFGAGTMREDTRVLKHNLECVLPYMEKFPVFLGLINQVMMKPTQYGPAKTESGGGNTLKHLCHTHIVFGSPKDDYNGIFLMGTESRVKLVKSKLSPRMEEIPCYIDVTKGGKIDEVVSFVKYISDKSVGMIEVGSWYQFGGYLKNDMFVTYPQLQECDELNDIFSKNYRKADMYELISTNEDLYNLLQIALIDFLCGIYPAQKIITESYKTDLVSKCKYLNS